MRYCIRERDECVSSQCISLQTRLYKALHVQNWFLLQVSLSCQLFGTGHWACVGWCLLRNVKLFPLQWWVLDLLWSWAAGADEADRHYGGSQEIWMGRTDTGFGSLPECSRAGTLLCQGCSAAKMQGGTSGSYVSLIGVSPCVSHVLVQCGLNVSFRVWLCRDVLGIGSSTLICLYNT